MPNKIYEFLKENSLTTKDESAFLQEYSNPEKAKELYSFFKDNNLTQKDEVSFYGEYLKPSASPQLSIGFPSTAVESNQQTGNQVPDVKLQPFNEQQVKAGITKSTQGINQLVTNTVPKVKVTAIPGSKGDKAIKATENQLRQEKYTGALQGASKMYEELSAQYEPLAEQLQEIEAAYQANPTPELEQQYKEMSAQANFLGEKINATIEGSKILEAGLRNANQLDELNKESNFNVGKKANVAVNQTFNNLVNSTGKIIESVGDIAYNFSVAKAYGAADDDTKATDEIGKGIDEYYKELNAATMQKVPKLYQEYSPIGDKPEADKLLYFGMNAVAQLAPTVAAGVATGGTGAAVAGFTMEFGGMYDAFHEPIKQRYIKQGLSEKEAEAKADQEAALMAAGGAGVIAQLDRFGAMQLINSVSKRALVRKVTTEALQELGEKTGKEAAEMSMKKALQKNLVEFAKGYGKAVGGEAVTEPIQELVPAAEQDIYNAVTGTDTFTEGGLGDMSTWENAANAGIGAIMASSPGGLVSGLDNVTPQSYRNIKSISNEEQLVKFQEDLQGEVEAGITTPEQAEEAMQTVQRVQEVDKLIPDNITDLNARTEAVNLISEKQELTQQIEGKDPALIGPQTERIKEIDTRLKDIAAEKKEIASPPTQGYRPKKKDAEIKETETVESVKPETDNSVLNGSEPAQVEVSETVEVVSPEVTEVQEIVPEEGSVVQIDSLMEGGQPREFEFKDGTWKQKVGNEYTGVSEDVQNEAQRIFNFENQSTLQNEVNNSRNEDDIEISESDNVSINQENNDTLTEPVENININETTPDQQMEGKPDGKREIKGNQRDKRQDVLVSEGGVDETTSPVPETGVKHEKTAELRKEFGIPEYEKSEKSQKKLEEQADDLLKNKYDINSLIQRTERGVLPSDVEQIIMSKYIAGLAAKIEKNPTNELIDQARRAIEVSDRIGGSEVARSLAARRNLEYREETLLDYFMQDIQLNEGAALTENQKSVAIKEYEQIKAAKEALEEKLSKLQEEFDKKVIQSEVKKFKPSKKKTHDEYVKERQEIISDIKNKLKGLRKDANVTILPYARELITISPDIYRMLKSYVSEGIVNLDEIIGKIHTEVKEVIPEITKDDVRSVIAGNYQEKKQTRAEVNRQIFELKQQAKLVEKLESLQKGIEPDIPEKKRVKLNRDIQILRKQIKENDLNKLHEYKKRLISQLRNLESDLESGNIKEKEDKPTLKLDKQATVLKDIYIRLKQERERRLLVRKFENRTRYEKFKQTVIDAANIPRTVMSSMDFSAPLRQAVVVTTSHPIVATKAFGEMFKQALSQKRFDRWFYDIRDDYRFAAAQESGLYIADPHDLKLTAKEEFFMSNLAEKIPVIGKLIKGSERAYVSYLNKMRWDLYNMYAEQFEENGQTPYNSPEIYRGLASFINNATGRGGTKGNVLGVDYDLEQAAPVLNAILFSPRLIASRINFLNPIYYSKLPKPVRILAIKDMAKFISTGITTLALISLAWGCEDDCKDCKDCVQVELDPRSTDFGKIRVNDTRWDIWGGYQQYIRMLAQIMPFVGGTKSAKTGEIAKLDGSGPFSRDRGDVVTTFFRGKLAPIPSAGVDLFTGKTITGEKATLIQEAKSHLAPLIFKDVKEAFEDKGVKALFTAGIPAMFGVGVSTYENRHDKYVIEDDEIKVSANARGISDKIEERRKLEREENKREKSDNIQVIDKEFNVTPSEKTLRDLVDKKKNPFPILITELEKLPNKKREETLNRWIDIEIAPDDVLWYIFIDKEGNITANNDFLEN